MIRLVIITLFSIFASRKSELSVFFLPHESADSVQLVIFTSFNRKELIFQRDKDAYKASLELQVEVFKDKKRDLIWGNSWNFDVFLRDPKDARSTFWYTKFYVASVKKENAYFIKASLKDVYGNTYARTERSITAPILVSDPIPIDSEAYKLNIRKPVSSFVRDKSVLIYIKSTLDSVPFTLELVKIKAVKKVNGVLQRGDNTISLDLADAGSGLYTLVLNAQKERREIPLVLYTAPLDFTSSEFNQLIIILSFFFTNAELDSLEKYRDNRDSLSSYWSRMWKRKDPTPETELNEFEEEIFSRIEYADEKYASPFRRGALTDRGICYIVLGPPDEIEQHPFDLEARAYEIWRYYEINYRFVFMDLKGVGDYEIIDPPRTAFYELLKRFRP
ncbi:MAG: GWxTD domain-containing protein [candidate division WOR-3 bacterium]